LGSVRTIKRTLQFLGGNETVRGEDRPWKRFVWGGSLCRREVHRDLWRGQGGRKGSWLKGVDPRSDEVEVRSFGRSDLGRT